MLLKQENLTVTGISNKQVPSLASSNSCCPINLISTHFISNVHEPDYCHALKNLIQPILFYFIDPVYSTQYSLSNFHVNSSFAHLKYKQTLTEVTINYQYNIILIIIVH